MTTSTPKVLSARARPTAFALFAGPYRPFFLGAGAMALLGTLAWLLVLAGELQLPGPLDPLAWHSHEMLFGAMGAALSGFLLTAVPNWTGRLPLAGPRLMGLFGLWLAARLALVAGAGLGLPAVAALDLAFWLLLVLTIAREILAGRNWRNLPVLVGLGLFTAANALFHAGALGWLAGTELGWRLGVATLALLISLIGGRIVPSFTGNWLAARGEERPAAGCRRLERLALAVTLAALAGWCWRPDGTATGILLLVAALLQALRLRQWQGWRTRGEALVWILHAGFAWLVLGLLLAGLAALAPESVPPSAALHALTAGALATMTLAVMTRALLGHTGRALTAGRGTLLAYLLLLTAGLLRVAASFADLQPALLTLSGAAWIAAFALFLAIYGPIACRRRPDGRPG